MSSLSSDEGNWFSTQDRETFKRLISMDRESFLANYTGLESTKLIPVKKVSSDRMDTDSDDSMELDYLEQLRNPQPTPVVVQEQKPVEEKPVIQGPTRTRTLRQRQANQLRPYTTEKQRYDAMLRRAQYHELLQKDTQEQHHRRKTAEDRYEQEDRDESDDEEYEAPSLEPEDLPTQSMEKLTIIPSRRRSSAEKVKVPVKPSRTSHSETPPPLPSNDVWTTIPRTTTTYISKKSKVRSAQEKGKGRAKPLQQKQQEPVTNNVPSHVDDALRDVFSDLFSDNDAASQSSLDSDLVRIDKERLEQKKQGEEASLEVEEEEIHYNSRRRRARRFHSLENESDDDTPLPSNNDEDSQIFEFPVDPEPSYRNHMDNPQVLNIPPSRTERPISLPRRRKVLKEDDGFVELDGSEYDKPARKKKRTTTHGVLPYNFLDQNLPKPSNPPVTVEEMEYDDPPSQEESPPRSPSPSIDQPTYRSPPSSSRPRERIVGNLIQATSRSSTPRVQHHRSAAQNSRTARKSGSNSKSTSSRKRQASSSSSQRTSITPLKAKHNPKRANPNGKLYIVPGPDWTSFRRPHLTNGWAPTGEHRTRSSDQARTTREWSTEIQQWVNEHHEPPRQRAIHHRQQQQIPDEPRSSPPPTSPTSSQDTGPTDPFARLLYKHPSLSTDYGIPSVEGETHLRGTCYIMLGYLKQVLSPEDAVPSIGAYETFIELFGRKIILTQDVDQTILSIRALFREAFKRIGSFFEKQSATIPVVAKELEIAKLMPFFRFVSERLINWASRLGGGQQRPTMELLNNQCKLLYTRAWATAGMAVPYDQYNKMPPLLDKRETIAHSCKALLILFIYAMDWMARFGTTEDRNDCKQRLLWLLYWIGPDYAQLLRSEDGGLTAKVPLVAEAWICVLHSYTPNECWQRVMQLLEQQTEQDGWTSSQKKQKIFHWLLVLNGLRHVDSSGIYTTPLTGLASVDGLCGHELALELITASAL